MAGFGLVEFLIKQRMWLTQKPNALFFFFIISFGISKNQIACYWHATVFTTQNYIFVICSWTITHTTSRSTDLVQWIQ